MKKFLGIIAPLALAVCIATAAPRQVHAGSEPYIGEISMFAGNYAPQGWAFCDGQLLSISENAALFTILGNTYGGDGRTTFALPDLRGRAPVHAGRGPRLSHRVLGEKNGQENVTLNVGELPSHNHPAGAMSGNANNSNPVGHLPAATGRTRIYSSGSPADATMDQSAVGPAGGSQAHNNMQPYLVINYIIALQGIFPSSN